MNGTQKPVKRQWNCTHQVASHSSWDDVRHTTHGALLPFLLRLWVQYLTSWRHSICHPYKVVDMHRHTQHERLNWGLIYDTDSFSWHSKQCNLKGLSASPFTQVLSTSPFKYWTTEAASGLHAKYYLSCYKSFLNLSYNFIFVHVYTLIQLQSTISTDQC